MLRILIRTSLNRGCVIFYEKNNHKTLHFLKYKSPGGARTSFILSLHQISFVQTRLSSSYSFGSTVCRIFSVSAESTPPTDHTSPATDITSPSATDAIANKNALSDAVEYIPPPPVPPEVLEEPLQILNRLGEPTFQSLGFGGWSPIGLVQTSLEYFHVDLGLPWWGSITLATVILRVALFPLVIKTQRHSAILSNHMPAIQRLQLKMTEARRSGNELEAMKIGYELQQYMDKWNVKPLRSALMPFIQAPIFISVFIGLRRCANLPVESFKNGGMLWFTDLTVADPYYLLPVITSLTMLATIEIGAEGQKLTREASVLVRYGLRALPLVVLPFSLYFPSAVLCYWTSTNFVTLFQVGFLRIPAVRAYFKIDPRVKHSKDSLPLANKGFVETVQESWSNMKVTTDISERERIGRIAFQKAGTGPLVKTYKQNPLKKNVIDVKAKMKEQ